MIEAVAARKPEPSVITTLENAHCSSSHKQPEAGGRRSPRARAAGVLATAACAHSTSGRHGTRRRDAVWRGTTARVGGVAELAERHHGTDTGIGNCMHREGLFSRTLGAQTISKFDTSGLGCSIAGQVPRGDGEHAFRVKDWANPKSLRSQDVDFIAFALAAGALQLVHNMRIRGCLSHESHAPR